MKGMTSTAVNQGNVDLNGVKARISEAAYGVLMDMLSNLYTNASEAVLREYSVNGWDEHQKHGVERPVEVTLPSLLQPTLVIRDFGLGLPLDGTFHMEGDNKVWDTYGVAQVFGEYGESSKRKNDVEVGGFGIGSKAAYALGHQFMVTSYKDGWTCTVLFTLDEDGCGTMSVLHEGDTQEPNGLQISLGVEDVDAMNESAERFFSFWNRGDVLVNGETPTPVFERLTKVSDEIYLDTDGRGEAYAVMGPVAYPVDRSILRKVSTYLEKQGLDEVASLPLDLVDSDTDLYLRVPIGGVIPAPNREALRDKEKTVHTLGAIFLAIHQESKVKIQTEVDAATSFAAAAKAFHATNTNLGAFSVARSSVTWQGQKITRKTQGKMTHYVLRDKSWRSSTKVVGEYPEFKDFEIEQALNSLTVTGVKEDDFGKVRRFVKRYLEENEDGITRVFVTSATAVSFGWFQVGVEGGFRTTDLEGWRTIIRGMRQSTPRTVNEPSYSTGYTTASRDLDDRDLLTDIIAEGKDLVPFTDSSRHLNKFQRKVLEDYTVVVLLATQSEDAFNKRVEADGSVKVVDWHALAPLAKAEAQKVIDSVTDEEREALGARQWIQEHADKARQIAETVDALSRVGEVTVASWAAAADALPLAREFAAPLSDKRFEEIKEAYNFVHSLPHYSADMVEALGEAYEDDSVTDDWDDAFPLLSVSKVREYHRSIARLQKNDAGEYVYPTWGFGKARHEEALVYLEHALAYVNAL